MVTIIIPVCNSEKYLCKCISSVLCQTYQDLECVLVNDGSTDGSLELCREYKAKDDRIVLVSKKNEGVDKARFEGLCYAKGEFVMFLDSDDWLECDAVEMLMAAEEKTHADMVVGQSKNVFRIGAFYLREWRTPPRVEYVHKMIYNQELMDKYYLSFFGVNILPVVMWATLYRRSVIEEAQLLPCGLSFGEDLIFNMNLFPYVKRYYVIDKCVYNYRRNTWGTSKKYLDGWLKNARLLFEQKMFCIKFFKYDRAYKWQLIEMVNYIKTYVQLCLKYDKDNMSERKKVLENELQQACYKDLSDLKIMEYSDTHFLNAVLDKDSNLCFEIMRIRMLKEPFMRRCLNWLIQILRK